MAAWIGHLPVTREALLAALDRAMASDIGLSRCESALWTACEARAAAANGEFAEHFSAETDEGLAAVAEAFRVAGAAYASHEVVRFAQMCCVSPSPRARRECLNDLEHQLNELGDAIDATLAAYAVRVLRASRALVVIDARHAVPVPHRQN